MPTILSEPVLTLALDNLHKLRDVDGDNLCSMWAVFTKCKENLLNGQRLENLSWRLWFRQAFSERKMGPRPSTDVEDDLSADLNLERCSKPTSMSGSDLVKTFNSLPRQLSSTSVHKLIDSISPKSEFIVNVPTAVPIKHETSPIAASLPVTQLDTICAVVEDEGLKQENVIESNNYRDIIPEGDPDLHSVEKKRKIFFIAESLEEEEFPNHIFEKPKNSRTVMNLQALTCFPEDSSLDFSESNGSESMLDEEGWESVASSYQPIPPNANNCVFEKINVPKQHSQHDLPKPSLLSSLFQKRTSTIPYSKPSIFKGLSTLNTLDKDHERDSLAKELSSSLHQNVLRQRQQHEHFCRPFHREVLMNSSFKNCEYNFATSPGYYGSGW